jgi:hypothetical protein
MTLKRKLFFGWLLLVPCMLGLLGCRNPYHRIKDNTSKPISHEEWNTLLQRHVSETGWVNYRGFLQDSLQLQQYLELLGQHPPNDRHWTPDERKAYFLNLYNAATVQLILRHYPVQSIKDIVPRLQIPFVNSPWTIPFIRIAGGKYSLDHIEHGIIRKEFADPRIHFAVNCASASCPVLHQRAYTGHRLDEQLDQQARKFINDPRFNRINQDNIQISSIFRWYSGDFPRGPNFIDFLNQYSTLKINPKANVTYQDYDWRLNEAGQ